MISLDAPPEANKGAFRPSRLLVLGALTAAIAVVVAAVVVVTISSENAEPTAAAATGAPPAVRTEVADLDSVPPTSSAEPTTTGPAGPTATGSPEPAAPIFATGNDPIASGTAEACSRFRNGATVADFSAWFETEVGTVGVAERELFRTILQRALTEECPEVVPAGS